METTAKRCTVAHIAESPVLACPFCAGHPTSKTLTDYSVHFEARCCGRQFEVDYGFPGENKASPELVVKGMGSDEKDVRFCVFCGASLSRVFAGVK